MKIGGTADPAIERAARLGDGWLATPGLTVVEAQQKLAHYEACCAKHQRPIGVCAIRRNVFVGATAEEAAAMHNAVATPAPRKIPSQSTIVGDVSQVAAAFQELVDIGFTDVIVRSAVADQAQALATIQRLKAVKALL